MQKHGYLRVAPSELQRVAGAASPNEILPHRMFHHAAYGRWIIAEGVFADADIGDAWRIGSRIPTTAWVRERSVRITDYGAIPDGSTDSTIAVQAALDDIGPGQELVVDGIFKVRDTLSLIGARGQKICGRGPTTGFVVDAPGKNAIALRSCWGCALEDFGIYGTAGACETGLYAELVHWTRLRNIHVLAGATWGVVLDGCIYCDVDLQMNRAFASVPWANNQNGVLLRYHDNPAMACNADCIHLIIQQGKIGIQVADHRGAGGGTVLGGTFELMSSNPIEIVNASGVLIEHARLEQNEASILVRDSKSIWMTHVSAAEQIPRFENCSDCEIHAVTLRGVSIDEQCHTMHIGMVQGGYGDQHWDDRGHGTHYFGAQHMGGDLSYLDRQGIEVPSLASNGDFSQWTSGDPVGWWIDKAEASWECTGIGCLDTVRHWRNNAIRITCSKASSMFLDDKLEQHMAGWYCRMSGWRFRAGAQPDEPCYLQLRVDSAELEGTKRYQAHATKRDAWELVELCCYVPPDATLVQLSAVCPIGQTYWSDIQVRPQIG